MTSALDPIRRFVVLMLENRSFDHLLGLLTAEMPAIDGVAEGRESNTASPAGGPPQVAAVRKLSDFAMSFDPSHEFDDVQRQLFGSGPSTSGAQPTMGGFLESAIDAANKQHVGADATRIMECCLPTQASPIATLARQFAVFNYWFSPLPGPTWPNRFFVHAATSGGLKDSPSTARILAGFHFKNHTIYDTLGASGRDWRIYHGGLPQCVGIDSLRLSYIDPFTRHFRDFGHFEDDVRHDRLPDYTFIEPNYDTGGSFKRGDSMHPLNDLRAGELLVKRIYDALRNSPRYWAETMFVITFDEHGGFYDHVPPPRARPTGDDDTYNDPSRPFAFDRYGVRVPTLAVSAYTAPGTIIGASRDDPRTWFDHASILATVEKRFGLAPLTQRDRYANTMDAVINLSSARTDAPLHLPDPYLDTL